MAIIAFLVFAIVFCHFMNKWSKELEQFEGEEEAAPGGTIIDGRFGRLQEDTQFKRAA
jgi:hypothetical protein